MSIDLNAYSFDEWVAFVFDHPISDPEWYFLDEWEWRGDPEIILNNFLQLLKNPEFLIVRYNAKQVEQGFWFLLGPSGKLSDWLWDQNISWELRKECIAAMVNVFEKLFTKTPLGETYFMWWDLFRTFEENPDEKVNDAKFESLSQILNLNSIHCQKSALHGLGHSTHPQKAEIIRRFLEEHPDIDDEMKSYALAAINGTVL